MSLTCPSAPLQQDRQGASTRRAVRSRSSRMGSACRRGGGSGTAKQLFRKMSSINDSSDSPFIGFLVLGWFVFCNISLIFLIMIPGKSFKGLNSDCPHRGTSSLFTTARSSFTLSCFSLVLLAIKAQSVFSARLAMPGTRHVRRGVGNSCLSHRHRLVKTNKTNT